MSSKYYSKKTYTSDGIKHDSQKEANRWAELKLLQRAGEISDLQRQVEFELIPNQYEVIEKVSNKTGKPLKPKTKLIERKVCYIADFVYTDKNGNRVVEDTKSEITQTPVFVVKRKLMLFVHGIKVKIV